MSKDIYKQHIQLVKSLSKTGEDILRTFTPEKMHLVHMATGIAGEAGELLDAIKKYTVYNKSQLDVANVIEELGDLEFYMEGLRSSLGISRVEVLEHNIAKLNKRYGTVYTDTAASARVDKAGEEVVAPVTPIATDFYLSELRFPAKLKHEAINIRKLSKEMQFALNIASNVWADIGQELVITSGNDGKHKVGSKHYTNNACDFRIFYFTSDQKIRAAQNLQNALGKYYAVVLESDHIHCEYDPKHM